ncbi:MAG: flavodoxin domain-containing protein [Chloroflexota bacterium]|nr:flavodoxin domain-containing protein [Chloroflexota bacterium]
MKILVAVASKHGGTQGIAEAIAAELRTQNLAVDLHDMQDILIDVGQYDAVILGSAVYAGNWLPEAKHFIDLNHPELSRLPVWLFSSGPLGTVNPQPQVDPGKLVTNIGDVAVRDHKVFVGRLDPAGLGLGERLMSKVVGAPAGDFRNWDEIRAWARGVASECVGGMSLVHQPTS